MSASDAAPLPRLGEVFFDVRGNSRTMRLSWYADTGVAVFSIWQGGTCTGTFRLPMDDLPRMIDSLQRGNQGVDPIPATGPTDVTAISPSAQGADTAYLDEYRGRRDRGPAPDSYDDRYPAPAPPYRDAGYDRDAGYGDPDHGGYGDAGHRGPGYDAQGYEPPAAYEAPAAYEGQGYGGQGYEGQGYEGQRRAPAPEEPRYDERRGGYDERNGYEDRGGFGDRAGYSERPGFDERPGFEDRGYGGSRHDEQPHHEDERPGYEDRGYDRHGYDDRSSSARGRSPGGYGEQQEEYSQQAPLSAPPAIPSAPAASGSGQPDGPFPLAYREEPAYDERSAYPGQGQPGLGQPGSGQPGPGQSASGGQPPHFGQRGGDYYPAADEYPAGQRGGDGYGYREDFQENREQRYPRRR